MRRAIICYFLLVISSLANAHAENLSGYAESANKWIICSQMYARCSTAACIPSPDNPTSATLCQCDVVNGPNLGLSTCEQRQPITVRPHTTLIRANFSFEKTTPSKLMTCDSSNAWSDCMEAPCIIDPTNPTKTICRCQLKQGEAFATLGGGCNPDTCQNHFWSGITIDNIKQNLRQLLNLSAENQDISQYQCTSTGTE